MYVCTYVLCNKKNIELAIASMSRQGRNGFLPLFFILTYIGVKVGHIHVVQAFAIHNFEKIQLLAMVAGTIIL